MRGWAKTNCRSGPVQNTEIMCHLDQLLQACSFEICEPSDLPGQFSAAQVDVAEGGLNTAMPGVRRDLMNIPTGTGQIGQAEVAQRMRTELGNAGLVGNHLNRL